MHDLKRLFPGLLRKKSIPQEKPTESYIEPLELELLWLSALIQFRVRELTDPHTESTQPQAPDLQEVVGPYHTFLKDHECTLTDRLLVLLPLAQLLQPKLFDQLLQPNPETGKPYYEIGGLPHPHTRTFRATARTVVFLAGGTDFAAMTEALNGLTFQHRFIRDGIITPIRQPKEETHLLDTRIELDSGYLEFFLYNRTPRPDAGNNFPANLLETNKTFEDLILPEKVFEQLQPAINFLQVEQDLFDPTINSSALKSGFVLLLYGPPGTGKTLTASVLGKHLGLEVFSIALSRVVSKYIGETEKNLERVFERLQNRKCILFFDEADALFGKRSEVKDSKDRYANQEVAYLLQRIEQCPNLVILASNYKQNLDDAFKRRILSQVYIPPPAYPERLQIWQQGIPNGYRYDPLNLPEKLAEDYQLTGAHIANIIKLGCIKAAANQETVLNQRILMSFVRAEFVKDGRIFEVSRDRKGQSTYTPTPTRGSKYALGKNSPGMRKPTASETIDMMSQRLKEFKHKKKEQEAEKQKNETPDSVDKKP